MLTVLYALAAAVLLLALHLVVLPLSKRRPVLLRGAETLVAVGLLIVCISYASPWLLLFLPVQLIIARSLRPWLVFGINRNQVDAALTKTGTMVRQSVTIQGDRYLFSGGSAQILSVGAQLVLFRLPSSKKVTLFKNVFRKSLQNYTLE